MEKYKIDINYGHGNIIKMIVKEIEMNKIT